MFTVKLHWIPNTHALLELAAASCGEVLLDLPDGLSLIHISEPTRPY